MQCVELNYCPIGGERGLAVLKIFPWDHVKPNVSVNGTDF